MAENGLRVQQQSDSISVDGTGVVTQRGDREGAAFDGSIESKYRQWLVAGKVFSAQFATPGGTATAEANTDEDLTEPFFRMTVPSSKVLVPIRVLLQSTVVWVTAYGMFLYAVDTDTYTTGGAAPLVTNQAMPGSGDSALGTTAMTNVFDGDSVLTEAAQTNPLFIHYDGKLTGDVHTPLEYNILKGDPMTMIHGESSFNVVLELAGALELHYIVTWAELDKNALVNS